MFFLIFIVCLLLQITEAARTDRFIFNITVYCRHNQAYDFNLIYEEIDITWLFKWNDDTITDSEEHKGLMGPWSGIIHGQMNGDGLFAKRYEVLYEIWHTCTPDGSEHGNVGILDLEFEIGKDFKVRHDIHLRPSFEIDDFTVGASFYD
ncbi:unnamed protein product [Caenorhabditis angaria]|uniref:Uncharacterized protein n=1 Tax=Caenorhabditis angaria TaxID=860376 RepID=A0A9P1ILW7_9PELO|nr:unnamed protein product [Caenorhabditis angaria]